MGREYSDLNPVYDKEIFQQLIDGGVDEQLALHYAHLWIRDPLTLFKEHIHEDDEQNSDHFEVCNRLFLQAYSVKICVIFLFKGNGIGSLGMMVKFW